MHGRRLPPVAAPQGIIAGNCVAREPAIWNEAVSACAPAACPAHSSRRSPRLALHRDLNSDLV